MRSGGVDDAGQPSVNDEEDDVQVDGNAGTDKGEDRAGIIVTPRVEWLFS